MITDPTDGFVRSLIWKTVNDMKKELFVTVPFSGVSVILGAVDEAQMIRKTVYAVLETCDSSDIAEFVIMQSQKITSGCLKSINDLKAEVKDVPINIYVESKPCVGMAIRDGIGYAVGSHTALLPSDFGIHPGCLAAMIKESKKHPDRVIKTSRWMRTGSFSDYGKERLAFNRMGNIFLSLLFGTHLSDITSATQLFPSELYKRIKWQEEDFPFLLEMTLKPLRLGVKFSQVPAVCLPRVEGKSKNSTKKTLSYLPTAIKNRFVKRKNIYE